MTYRRRLGPRRGAGDVPVRRLRRAFQTYDETYAAPVMRGRQRSRPMRGRVLSSALGLFAAYVFVRSLPDIKRYIRMRQM